MVHEIYVGKHNPKRIFMIKRTLHFGNPAYLSLKNEQLKISYPNQRKETLPIAQRLKIDANPADKSVPIEDIGIIILENSRVTVTTALMDRLTAYNVGIITCDSRHMPTGLLLPLEGHSEQSERFKVQIKASVPLKKNLWQQTVQAKIKNQALLLRERGLVGAENMMHWAKSVNSGDTHNLEARAAAYYWKHIFEIENFTRARNGIAPNNLLNYGYAILRAITARALVGSGLFPTLGIHHRNKYNAYCLADDIMEPYRPYVDLIVCHFVDNMDDLSELTIQLKKQLLELPALDVFIDGKKSPLLVAMSRTTNSLYECFKGSSRKLLYPEYD